MCMDINTGDGEWITGSIPGSEGSRLAAAGQSREAVKERSRRPTEDYSTLPSPKQDGEDSG